VWVDMLRTATRLVVRSNAALSACSCTRSKHSLPDLPYNYKALEPVVSGEIMELHHSKHHATYVNNLNAAEDQLSQSLEKGEEAPILLDNH